MIFASFAQNTTMSRYILFILSALLCSNLLFGQTLADNPSYRAMTAERDGLKSSEDSLSKALAASRKRFEDGDTKAGDDIVRQEGEIYDLKAKISRVSSRMTAIEQEFASQSLEESPAFGVERREFFGNDIFVRNLSRKDLSMLNSAAPTERAMVEASNKLQGLYAQLKSMKVAYEASSSQAELDRLRGSAENLKSQIATINAETGAAWIKLYNFKLDTYLVLLDKLQNVDRTTLEALESQGREVRRAEAFSEELLNPAFVVFEAQRGYVHAYEKAIASGEKLRMALDSISRLKPLLAKVDSIENLNFDPRVLTIYAPVSFIKQNYPIQNVADVPQTILPETGIYYSIQIALMSAPPKTLDMFKGAWPLQVEHTADGKFRYMVGGFDTYADAAAAVSQLYKAGYKAPVMMAWIDGKMTSTAKAKAAEASRPKSEGTLGSFKIEVNTTDPAVADKLRAVVEMHAKGKSIARVTSGKDMIFTITEFGDRYEAEVIAQIIRERTAASAEVAAIK